MNWVPAAKPSHPSQEQSRQASLFVADVKIEFLKNSKPFSVTVERALTPRRYTEHDPALRTRPAESRVQPMFGAGFSGSCRDRSKAINVFSRARRR